MATNRLTGLISGMDTESLVTQLVSAYAVKKNKVIKNKTKLEWKQEKWKELNTKIYNLYSKTISNMQYTTAYRSKKTSVSDETKASVVANDNAVNGTQTLSISKLAAAGYLTGAKLNGSDGKLTNGSKLKDLGITTEATFTVKATATGEEKTITVNGDTTLRSLTSQLASAGLTASFDETQQRLYISSKESGTENEFSLVGVGGSGVSAMMKLGLYTKEQANAAVSADVQAEWDKWSAYDGITFSLDKDGNVTNITGAADSAQEQEIKSYLENQYQTKLQEFIDAQQATIDEKKKKMDDAGLDMDDAVAKWKDYQQKQVAQEGPQMNHENAKKAYNDAKKLFDANDPSAPTAQELADLKQAMDDAEQVRKDAEKAATDALDVYNTSVKGADGKAVISNAEMQAYIKAQNNLDPSASGSFEANKEHIAVTVSDGFFGRVQDSISAKADWATAQSAPASNFGNRIAAENCVINLNGVEYVGSKNSITVNGLTISAKAVTTEAISVVTDNDYQKVYDNIKNFFTEYNKLINEMDSLFNAASSKGYEPLTDEEKEAMSDSDIEKWEAKIKDSLLRRDNTLDEISNVMKNALMRSYEVNGKKYSLASFGISTLGYFNAAENEKSAYHIDGDEDDSNTSGKKNTLMTMISTEPEVVTGFFTQLLGGLYEDMGKKMKSTEFRSIYHVYNDKQMANELKDYEDDVKYWEDYLEKIEEKYYKQFSDMETALAKLQSSSSALAGLMGNG